jgi:hypothetical protein
MCERRESSKDVASVALGYKGHYKKETNQGNKGNSEFTNLLDDALCCAIWTSHDDSVVSPPDIEDATHGLQNVEYKKGGLSFKSNKSGEECEGENHSTDHVDVSRPLEQLPFKPSSVLPVPSYVPLCNRSNRTDGRRGVGLTPI